MPYSATLDRINRRPCWQTFVQENSRAPAFTKRETMWCSSSAALQPRLIISSFSAHHGHSIMYFAVNDTSARSHFFGFDTFTGLPEDWNNDYKRGHFDAGARLAKTADLHVTYVAGMFRTRCAVSRDLSAAAAARMPQPSVANRKSDFRHCPIHATM
jgi:O-methyltransferase